MRWIRYLLADARRQRFQNGLSDAVHRQNCIWRCSRRRWPAVRPDVCKLLQCRLCDRGRLQCSHQSRCLLSRACNTAAHTCCDCNTGIVHPAQAPALSGSEAHRPLRTYLDLCKGLEYVQGSTTAIVGQWVQRCPLLSEHAPTVVYCSRSPADQCTLVTRLASPPVEFAAVLAGSCDWIPSRQLLHMWAQHR
jgi:hypothetical protein